MFPLRQNFFILEKQSNIENMKSNETESSSKLKMLKEKKKKNRIQLFITLKPKSSIEEKNAALPCVDWP